MCPAVDTKLMHCFKSAAILSTDVSANLIAHECHTDVAIPILLAFVAFLHVDFTLCRMQAHPHMYQNCRLGVPEPLVSTMRGTGSLSSKIPRTLVSGVLYITSLQAPLLPIYCDLSSWSTVGQPGTLHT